MKVKEIIENNEPKAKVLIHGENPYNDCDPLVEQYFQGELGDVPEHLKDCDVLRKGWSVVLNCHIIAVPYLNKVLYLEPLTQNIIDLCSKENVSVNRMLKECGLNKSVIDNLKCGFDPQLTKIVIIANYFNVTVDYLINNNSNKKNI